MYNTCDKIQSGVNPFYTMLNKRYCIQQIHRFNQYLNYLKLENVLLIEIRLELN